MSKCILIYTKLAPVELPAVALAADTARERKRGLAIAHVIEAMSRVEAGRSDHSWSRAARGRRPKTE